MSFVFDISTCAYWSGCSQLGRWPLIYTKWDGWPAEIMIIPPFYIYTMPISEAWAVYLIDHFHVV